MARWLAILVLMLPTVCLPAHAVTERIVFHLHESDPTLLQRALTNLENLMEKKQGQSLDVRLLLQGQSIRILGWENYDTSIHRRLHMLLDEGVRIEVSRDNYLEHAGLLDEWVKPALVDNIFSRIIELQKQGYTYLTP